MLEIDTAEAKRNSQKLMDDRLLAVSEKKAPQ